MIFFCHKQPPILELMKTFGKRLELITSGYICGFRTMQCGSYEVAGRWNSKMSYGMGLKYVRQFERQSEFACYWKDRRLFLRVINRLMLFHLNAFELLFSILDLQKVRYLFLKCCIRRLRSRFLKTRTATAWRISM